MIETLLGGLLGGVFRVVPEVLKFFDAKNARKHEIEMEEKEYKFAVLRGKQRIGELQEQERGAWNENAMAALTESIKGQGKPSGVKWIDGFSSLMRPMITFQWVVVLYPSVIVAQMLLYIVSGWPEGAVYPPIKVVADAVGLAFGPEEKALVSGVLNFWFLGRVFDRVR